MPCRLSAPLSPLPAPDEFLADGFRVRGVQSALSMPRACHPQVGTTTRAQASDTLQISTLGHEGEHVSTQTWPLVAAILRALLPFTSLPLPFGVIPWVISGTRALKVLAVCSLGTLGARGRGTFPGWN